MELHFREYNNKTMLIIYLLVKRLFTTLFNVAKNIQQTSENISGET